MESVVSIDSSVRLVDGGVLLLLLLLLLLVAIVVVTMVIFIMHWSLRGSRSCRSLRTMPSSRMDQMNGRV